MWGLTVTATSHQLAVCPVLLGLSLLSHLRMPAARWLVRALLTLQRAPVLQGEQNAEAGDTIKSSNRSQYKSNMPGYLDVAIT